MTYGYSLRLTDENSNTWRLAGTTTGSPANGTFSSDSKRVIGL
jgi:hypothetical protein